MNKLQKFDFKFANFIVGIVVVAMMFLPVLILKNTETSFTGFEIAFGKEFANLGSFASGEIAFNPLVLLAFILPLGAAIIPVFTNKGYLISTLLYIIATVLIFLIPNFTTVTITVLGNVNEVDIEWTYGIGLIVAAVLSIVGAGLGLFKLSKSN